jgi:hypothetical protein
VPPAQVPVVDQVRRVVALVQLVAGGVLQVVSVVA